MRPFFFHRLLLKDHVTNLLQSNLVYNYILHQLSKYYLHVTIALTLIDMTVQTYIYDKSAQHLSGSYQ